MKNYRAKFTIIAIFLFGSSTSTFANEIQKTDISSILEIQQYNRAIHIMAMLLIGFGLLLIMALE